MENKKENITEFLKKFKKSESQLKEIEDKFNKEGYDVNDSKTYKDFFNNSNWQGKSDICLYLMQECIKQGIPITVNWQIETENSDIKIEEKKNK